MIFTISFHVCLKCSAFCDVLLEVSLLTNERNLRDSSKLGTVNDFINIFLDISIIELKVLQSDRRFYTDLTIRIGSLNFWDLGRNHLSYKTHICSVSKVFHLYTK